MQKAFEEKFPLKELNNPKYDSYATTEKGHGREETRLHIVSDVPDELIDFTFEWKGLKKLCVAVSFRSEKDSGKKEPEMLVRYYISSADLTAEKFASAMRSHWDVENKLHWRLDVAMNEDDCRIRRGNAAELFSGIRHIAVNILTENKEFKAGLRRKMRRAAMDRGTSRQSLQGAGFRNLALSTQAIRISSMPRFCRSLNTDSQKFAPSLSDRYRPRTSFCLPDSAPARYKPPCSGNGHPPGFYNE